MAAFRPPPYPTAQPQGGFGSRLRGLLDPEVALPVAGALLGNQGNAGNFGSALMQLGQGMGQKKKRNATLELLQRDAPDLAEAIAKGVLDPSTAYEMYVKQRYAQKPKGQGFINAGGGNLFNADTGEWVSAPGGGAEGVAGLQPVWLEDENGNAILGQPTKDGKIIRSEMPEGLRPVSPYQRNFEGSRGTAEGKVIGEAAGALPGVSAMAQNVAKQVEDLKTDPYLPRMLGPVDSWLPNVTQDAARVQGKIAQLQGGAFLQARQLLKGGGAITDYEGQKAEAAFARLSQAQSEEDFKAALDDFNYFVQQGLQKLEMQAGQQRMGDGYPTGAQGGNRTTGGVQWSVEP